MPKARHTNIYSKHHFYGVIAFFICFLAFLLPASTLHAAVSPGTQIVNKAFTSYTQEGQTIAFESNEDIVTIVDYYIVEITSSVTPENVYRSDNITISIEVSNTGTAELPAGEIHFQLPEGTVLTSRNLPSARGTETAIVSAIVSIPAVPPVSSLNIDIDVQLPNDINNGLLQIPATHYANGVSIKNYDFQVTVNERTDASIKLMHYDENGSGQSVNVPVTQYDTGSGDFQDIPPPLIPASQTSVTDLPLKLASAEAFKSGQPLFIEVTDHDQNSNSQLVETIIATITIGPKNSGSISDSETLLLTETKADSGVFLGYFSTIKDGNTVSHDGDLGTAVNDQITASYTDNKDQIETTEHSVLIDPYGILFDSGTGKAMSGITVSLVNTDTGMPASVFGDDGISSYPATVVTGEIVTDGSGNSYPMIEGGFRFPLIPAGNYRLDVILPDNSGHLFPSMVSEEQIQALPGGPYAIVPGSYNASFTVVTGPAVHIDIPVDLLTTHLYVRKSANKSEVTTGDYLQYQVEVENTSALNTLGTLEVTDILPHGFRYEKGSAKLDNITIDDPVIAEDGRTLLFNLGNLAASGTASISYVTRVGAVSEKQATNTAFATAEAGFATSNIAKASVTVNEVFMRSHAVLMGRVAEAPTDTSEESNGISGVRLFLEDGTYVLTDKRGMYHFEGIKPGTHVIQLDTSTLPEGYTLAESDASSHISESGYSRFVDVQGGSLWQTDFYLKKPKQPSKGKLNLDITTSIDKQQNQQHFKIRLQNQILPVSNTRLMLVIPDNTSYVEGSSQIGNTQLNDPVITDNILQYRLGDLSADYDSTITFKVNISETLEQDILKSKAVVLVDTAAKKNQQLAPIENTLNLKQTNQQPSESGSLETAGGQIEITTDSMETKLAITNQEENKQTYDKVWINSLQPGFEWLFPSEHSYPAIPSIEIGIKHSPDENPSLTLNGKPVPTVNFEFSRTNSAQTVAFSLWRGVDIKEGDNLLELTMKDSQGNKTRQEQKIVHYSGPPVKAKLIEEQSLLLADGKNSPAIAIYLTDKDGAPVREGARGEIHISQPYFAKKQSEYDTEILAGSAPEKHYFVVGKDGIALIELEPTTEAGEVLVTLPFRNGDHEIRAALQPDVREWILVGLAEGTAGYNTLSGNIEPLSSSRSEDGLYTDDRIAFYAKGKISSDWLLTFAYDNTKKDENSLHQTIDPGTYYTVYGDTSEQRYDAASSEKLYIKIEKKDFYALFGDYETGLNKTHLSAYSRSLTGLKSGFRSDLFEMILFASESNQAFVKDEIQGKGVTGPYALSRSNIVMNSEKVTIETRDRFRSEIIISSEELSRHRDYDINYNTGSIRFRNPIFNRDPNLNPTFIVVKYESFDSADRELSYGGRGQVNVGEKLELGATHINEGRVNGDAKLSGADATYDITDNTSIHAEIAETRTDNNTTSETGDAYLVEVEHRTGKFDAHAYIQQQSENYGLGQTNNAETGTRKAGVDTSYKTTEKTDLKATLYRQYNLETDAERNYLETQGYYRMEKTSLHGGIKMVRDKFQRLEDEKSDLLTAGIDHRMLEGKLLLHFDNETAIGNKESTDFPALSRIGLDYALSTQTSLFGEHEWTYGNDRKTQTTSIGLKQRLWEGAESFAGLSREATETTNRAMLSSGIRQLWRITDHWSLDGGIEKSKTISDRNYEPVNSDIPPAYGSDEDFTSYSLRANYTPGTWIWNGLIEFRDAKISDQTSLATSAQTQPNNDLGLMTSFEISENKIDSENSSIVSQWRLGLAYRPYESQWIILDKLDLIYDNAENSGGETTSQSIINNLNLSYRHNDSWQSSFQYASKLSEDTIDNENYSGYTDLTGLETRYKFHAHWDIGARASVLHAWDIEQYDFSSGLSLGYHITKDIWLSLGYNFIGFRDEDFGADDFTSKGIFMQFRVKVDQTSIRSALSWLKE